MEGSLLTILLHIGTHLLSTVLPRESGMSHIGQKARRGALLRAVTHDNQILREPVPREPTCGYVSVCLEASCHTKITASTCTCGLTTPSNALWPQLLALPLAADTYGSAWPRRDRVMPVYSMLWKGLLSLVLYSLFRGHNFGAFGSCQDNAHSIHVCPQHRVCAVQQRSRHPPVGPS